MGALLTDLVATWLGGADALRMIDDASIAQAREEVRRRGAAAGLGAEACERLAAATSEVARNQLRHARGGMIGLRAVRRGEIAGLEVIAADAGDGIADPTAALRGALITDARPLGAGLGVGLSATYRLVDELDADVRADQGTCLWLRVFAAPVARSEAAIVARACDGERVSGDDAVIVRDPDSLLVGVIDGLGHGEPARDAAALAARELRADAVARLDALLDRIDDALAGSRGAVAALARLDHAARSLEHVGAGNVTARLARRDGRVEHLGGASRTLGLRLPKRRISIERATTHDLAAVVLYSDGVPSGLDLAADRALLREPPLVIAHQLVARHGRRNDDVTVLVAR